MENIKVEDMKKTEEVSAMEMEQVKGGPAYLKLEGVPGEATAAGHEKWIELQSVNIGIQRP